MTEIRQSPAMGALLRRRLSENANNLLYSWPERNHWKRYVLGAGVSVAAIWVLSLAYLFFLPKSYTSKWTLILPGSGAGVSVSVESIGQASSLAASPFSTSGLSPKVIYKEIATSEQVLAAAARSLNMKLAAFGEPRLKLIDETALMMFEIQGPTADIANAKARALISAFDAQLDLLRHDEIERRATSVRETLKDYQNSLRSARQRIFDLQEKSGIISVDQFNEVATSLEEANRKLTDVRAEAARLDAEQASLAARLGVDARLAAIGLELAADPTFAKALTEYAESSVSTAGQAAMLGSRNPFVIHDRAKRDAALATLRRIAKNAGVNENSDLPRLLLVLNSKSREELLKQLISGEALERGKHQEAEAIEKEIQAKELRIKAMSIDAAHLEDLKKDHLVAEAVFSSALARLDTNRADLYASYPIVQVLSPPDLPEKPSQPRLLYALAAGVVGSLLAISAWTLAWLRQLFVRKHRKNA
jgi:uncharacterized protein involved in exopolysaccharide biosynthesis